MNIAIIKISGKTIETFTEGSNGVKLIESLKERYNYVVIVHGGGKVISEWSQKLGVSPNFHNGQRITSKQSMEITAAVQGGLINSKLCAYLHAHSYNAIGLNGIDMNLFEADYLDKTLGYVGLPKSQNNSSWLLQMLQNNIFPVFSSICRDKIGNLMNVNADLFAGALAKTLKAKSVFFVSDIEGIKLNGKFQKSLTVSDLKNGISSGEITDGMIPKVNTCVNLIDEGIPQIWIGNDLIKSTINQNGTWINNYE